MTQHIETKEPLHASEQRKQEQPEQPANQDDREQEDDEEGDDDKLDEALEMTFPASDPISI